jgi:spore coat polysaccharide biosynthesis protein SpsF
MAKVIACIIARTVSTRLPLKILRDLIPGKTMIDFLISRIKQVESIDEIYICTSEENADDILEDIAIRNKVKLYRGSADQVIQRMLAVGEIEEADILIRITGDNPFASFEFIDAQVDLLLQKNLDYVRVIDVPIGATAEVMSRKALVHCYNNMDPAVSEYLMLFMFEPKNYRCGVLKFYKEDYSDYSVTVDTQMDFERTKLLLGFLNKENPIGITTTEILETYAANPSWPSVRFSSGGPVKLPYGKEISFNDFSMDMDRRKRNSEIVILHD